MWSLVVFVIVTVPPATMIVPLDVHVIQLYRIRGKTFGQVQIAVDRRIGQRAALRNGDVRGIAL